MKYVEESATIKISYFYRWPLLVRSELKRESENNGNIYQYASISLRKFIYPSIFDYFLTKSLMQDLINCLSVVTEFKLSRFANIRTNVLHNSITYPFGTDDFYLNSQEKLLSCKALEKKNAPKVLLIGYSKLNTKRKYMWIGPRIRRFLKLFPTQL